MIPNRRPTPVGEILTEEFLVPLGLTQTDLAKAMGVQARLVNELCRGSRAVTTDTALMLSRVFGTSAEFWVNAQQAIDLWEAPTDQPGHSAA
ncbi:HigA family addiction module antitoxin [Methylobacterium hispanicum]|uniref:HigA family addiction module antitoxin n=1 Tax=Methylobacterium hispanicum TaxID=270350 RepID=UPI002F3495AE